MKENNKNLYNLKNVQNTASALKTKTNYSHGVCYENIPPYFKNNFEKNVDVLFCI